RLPEIALAEVVVEGHAPATPLATASTRRNRPGIDRLRREAPPRYPQGMLFLHETHEVAGGRMEEFGAAVRDEWRPLIEEGGSARLLWCWELTHGTGASYQALTVTAVRDWAAWRALAQRMRAEPRWRESGRRAGTVRHESMAKLVTPARWSPLRDVALAAPPPEEPALYLHDTGWPFPGKLDDYVDALGSVYLPQIKKPRMISLEACWVTAP